MKAARAWGILKAIVVGLLGLLAAFAGVKIAQAAKAVLVGRVEGPGHNFAVDLHDLGSLTVTRPEGGTVKVTLPPGIRADRVRAVALVPGRPAEVEILP